MNSRRFCLSERGGTMLHGAGGAHSPDPHWSRLSRFWLTSARMYMRRNRVLEASTLGRTIPKRPEASAGRLLVCQHPIAGGAWQKPPKYPLVACQSVRHDARPRPAGNEVVRRRHGVQEHQGGARAAAAGVNGSLSDCALTDST
jgi:hypothetical protein